MTAGLAAGDAVSWRFDGQARQFGTFHGKRIGKTLVRRDDDGEFELVPTRLLTKECG